MELTSNKFRLKRDEILEELIWGKQKNIIMGTFMFLCPNCLEMIIKKISILIDFEKMRFNTFKENAIKIEKNNSNCKNISRNIRNNNLYLELLKGMMESYMEHEKWIRLLYLLFSKKLVIDACRLCLIKL
jgi:hypothetical protein